MHLTWLLLVLSGCRDNAPYARAIELSTLSEGIGGPKAAGQPGDFLLENDRIRLVVRGARRSLGPHTSGGSLMDADLQRPDPRYLNGNGNDRFAEMFPTVNMNVQLAEDGAGTVEILADGSDGGAAIIRTEGPSEPFLTMLGVLWAVVGQPDFLMRTDYILEPGAGAVRIKTTALFGETSFPEELADALAGTSDDSIDVLGLALESGATFGDFYLQGGSSDVFTPGVGFDEDSYVADLAEDGVNTFETPIKVDYLAGTADGVSYAIMADQGSLFVPLFTSSQTAAFGAGQLGEVDDAGEIIDDRFSSGTALTYERWFAVGQGDVGSALDALLEARGVPVGRIRGTVLEEGTETPLSKVNVFVYEPGADAPWSQMLTDVGDDTTADGSFTGTLPPGTWELLAYATGRPKGERLTVEVSEGGEVEVLLTSPQPGSVSFRVVDETGRVVPAKLTFFSEDGQDTTDTVLGDPYIAGDPASVVFAPYGTGTVVLPPGEYTAVASRGPEYDLGISEPFTVDADRAVRLQDLLVVHSVDTEGWVSADLHVHAINSFDSGTSLESRVSTMVSEGVEFLSSNDHDAVTDYAPVIQAMGLTPWVSSAVGVEVTTLELGHFLGFPLTWNALDEAGGAFDWTDMPPSSIFEAVRALGVPGQEDPVLIVAHPRDGILGYFDQFGLDPYSGEPGNDITAPNPTVEPSLLVATNDLISEDSFATDYDALELLNAKRFEIIRTPTATELAAYAADPDSTSIYDMLARTLDEQADLEEGVYTLGSGHEGQIDDWFTLLNLGFRYTALGNSDTHGKTSVESGCPRNFVMVGSDTPGMASGEEVAAAVRAGRVVASYGPFIRFWANDEAAVVGDTLVDADAVTLGIEVQSPDWFDVDRVELYENGTLIQEWEIDGPQDGSIDLTTDLEVNPSGDAWYVVIALGQDPLDFLYTPVEIPPIQLQDVVTDALSSVPAVSSFLGPAVPIPRTFPILPYALTNPIWVDRDGDGFDPPGLPDWLVPPAEEED